MEVDIASLDSRLLKAEADKLYYAVRSKYGRVDITEDKFNAVYQSMKNVIASDIQSYYKCIGVVETGISAADWYAEYRKRYV